MRRLSSSSSPRSSAKIARQTSSRQRPARAARRERRRSRRPAESPHGPPAQSGRCRLADARSVGRRRPPDQRGSQLRQACVPALVVEVGGHVPRLEVGRADDQQPVGRPGPAAQRAGEVSGALQPARRGEQRAQSLDLLGIHSIPCCLKAGARSNVPQPSKAGCKIGLAAGQRLAVFGCRPRFGGCG